MCETREEVPQEKQGNGNAEKAVAAGMIGLSEAEIPIGYDYNDAQWDPRIPNTLR
ncbi:MAG: hypothetical protein ACOZAN_00545 [Patescibacteria group bacterium]